MRKLLLICYLLMLSTALSSAQSLDSLLSVWQSGVSRHPSELIYLQTSKGIYETGEDLWFKAYVLDARSFSLSDRSSTLYLEMFDSRDSLVWQEMYPIEGGIASGVLYVDAHLPSGDYYLEAFSRHSFYTDSILPLASRKVRIVDNISEVSASSSVSVREESLFPPSENTHSPALRLVGRDSTHLTFSVHRDARFHGERFTLLGHMRGLLSCTATGILGDSLRVKIPLREFPYQGIAEFVLLDEVFAPMGEALVYVHPERKLHIEVTTDKEYYTLRDKVTMHIKVSDENGLPVTGANLGVSVFDGSYVNPSDPVDISSYCYLSSQLCDTLYNPAGYLRDLGEAAAEIGILSGTNPHRSIWNYAHTLSYRGELFLPDAITGHPVYGSKRKQRQMQGVQQMIQLQGADGEHTFFTWTDDRDTFRFTPEQMRQLRGGYLYAKPTEGGDSRPKLVFDDPYARLDSVRLERLRYYPQVSLEKVSEDVVREDVPVVNSDTTFLLDEVTVTAKGVRVFRDKMLGKLDSLARLTDDIWVCSHGYLENYVDGYSHRCSDRYDNPKSRRKPVIGQRYRIIKYEPIDENWELTDKGWAIYTGPYYTEEELLRSYHLWPVKGYYPNRAFEQPDELDMQLSIPDARNTLLWAPQVVTDARGEASVSFYCSDINTGFVGKIEGVSAGGLVGSTSYEFRVVRSMVNSRL